MSTLTQKTDVVESPIDNETPVSADKRILANLERTSAGLGDVSARVQSVVRKEYKRWRTFASHDVDGELTQFLAGLATAHRTHLADLVNAPSDALHAEALLTYRRSAAASVLQPMLERLGRRNLGEHISARFLQMLDKFPGLSGEFPENARLHRPDALFEAADDDSALIRLRKAAYRSRLATATASGNARNALRRLFKREALTAVPRSRLVATRQIAEFTLNVVLTEQLAPGHENLHTSVAARIAGAEKAVTEWANAVLVEERQAEVVFEAEQGPDWSKLPVAVLPVDEPKSNGSPTDPEVDDEAPPKDEEDPIAGLFERVEEQGRKLQSVLEKIASPTELIEIDEGIDVVFQRMSADFAKCGTFLLPLSDRDMSRAAAPRSRILKSGESWKAWHRESVDRFRYLKSLLGIRDHMLSVERDLVTRLSRATVDPVISTFTGTAARLNKATADAAEAGKAGTRGKSPNELESSLRAIQRRLGDHFEAVFRDLPGLVSSDQALTDPGRPEWEALNGYVEALPERLLMHTLAEDDAEIPIGSRPAEVQFRGLVHDALVIGLPDRLRKPSESLRSAVRRVWTETEQVQHIIQYNMAAALDELRRSDGSADTDDDEPDDDKPVATPQELAANAVKLSVDGLRRASQTLGQLALTLRPAWQSFVSSVDKEFLEDWVAIHRRLRAADSAEEQWAGMRNRLTRQVEKAAGRARQILHAGSVIAYKAFRIGRRRAESLIKIGRSAVGVADGSEGARFETADALASVSDLRDSLPLIYRRLFSFDPLEETTLLEGRSRDMVWVKQHFGRWKDSKQLGVVIIQAPLGSGRTSFLRSVRQSVFADTDVRYVNLAERIYHPDDFASLIAGALGIEDPVVSLDELEELLSARKRSDRPMVCLIDNLEHLVLRAAQSVNVVERVILFLSRADRSVYWVGTIGAYTWQFLTKTAGTAVGFVDSYRLSPLDRETAESLIINRHRRSGLALNFLDPPDPSTIMRQRLRRSKTPEQRQAVLREDYFDRLWKASGENIMLGLYYWIRSSEFNDDDSTLTVRPLKPLSFDFLSGFDLNQAFTLKAFFLHKTLSLADHSRIFHMGESASTAILESLLNSQVIEPVPTAERSPLPQDHHIRRDAIYRLQPLLIHPVTMLLQGKNIVY